MIAVGLEMYKHDNAAYPDSLDALVPGCLPAVPKNPFTGGAFVYKRVEADYVLSCVRKGRYRQHEELIFHAP